MARRLQTLCEVINTELPGYVAVVSTVHVNKDGKMGRLRIPRKGCMGKRLVVIHKESGREVYRHQAGEAYRCNDEVETWLADMQRAIAAGFQPTGPMDLVRILHEINTRST